MKTLSEVGKLIICLVVPLAVGFLGSMSTRSAIDTWFPALERPAFSPPDWVFAPVWTILYIMMGIAAFLVWRSGMQSRYVAPALVAFAVQLGLNFLWPELFFGRRQLLLGLVDIIALWAMIVVTMVLFFKVSRVAGLLMIPYLAWVTFASVLNFELWRLNR